MNITWLAERLDAYPQKNGFNDVVFKVFWRATAIDGDFYSTLSGEQPVQLDDEADFTPYDKLTQEQVLSWVKSSMGEGEIYKIENKLAQLISNQAAPAIASPPLPWGN